MKILIPISLLILGLAVGYVMGSSQENQVVKKEVVTESESIIYKIFRDTIIKTKVIEVAVPVKIINDTLLTDTLSLDSIVVDTLTEVLFENEKDSIVEERITILSDTRLKIYKLPLKHIETNVNTSDSLLKTAIDIIEVDKKFMNVEFWESPINFSGYKLSKSKLVLYGLSPQLNYQLFKKNKVYYLKFHSITYELYETVDFKKFIQTSELLK